MCEAPPRPPGLLAEKKPRDARRAKKPNRRYTGTVQKLGLHPGRVARPDAQAYTGVRSSNHVNNKGQRYDFGFIMGFAVTVGAAVEPSAPMKVLST